MSCWRGIDGDADVQTQSYRINAPASPAGPWIISRDHQCHSSRRRHKLLRNCSGISSAAAVAVFTIRNGRFRLTACLSVGRSVENMYFWCRRVVAVCHVTSEWRSATDQTLDLPSSSCTSSSCSGSSSGSCSSSITMFTSIRSASRPKKFFFLLLLAEDEFSGMKDRPQINLFIKFKKKYSRRDHFAGTNAQKYAFSTLIFLLNFWTRSLQSPILRTLQRFGPSHLPRLTPEPSIPPSSGGVVPYTFRLCSAFKLGDF